MYLSSLIQSRVCVCLTKNLILLNERAQIYICQPGGTLEVLVYSLHLRYSCVLLVHLLVWHLGPLAKPCGAMYIFCVCIQWAVGHGLGFVIHFPTEPFPVNVKICNFQLCTDFGCRNLSLMQYTEAKFLKRCLCMQFSVPFCRIE